MLVGFCTSDDLIGISAYHSADSDKLRNIESPFPEFEFGHKGLSLPDPLPQFRLRDASVLPSLHKQLDHSQVEIGSK